ncbi:unnamed protein product [Thelazia callipaeda]|uniref:Peptidase A1 domain-containing protein n=1 Tax=Thelazia callipaeda TaxID=103827 RepID=A0A0N5CJF7_THECL|nr:unnamed protein product [Thelazia callipaeda]
MLQYLLTEISLLILISISCTSKVYQIPLHPVYGESQNHVGYSVKARIGPKLQEYTLLIDTLLPSSWVVGPGCSDPCCLNKTTFISSYKIKKSKKDHFALVDYTSRNITINLLNDEFELYENNDPTIKFFDKAFSFGAVESLEWQDCAEYTKIDGMFSLYPKIHWSTTIIHSLYDYLYDKHIPRTLTIAMPRLVTIHTYFQSITY